MQHSAQRNIDHTHSGSLLVSAILEQDYATYPTPGDTVTSATQLIFQALQRITDDPTSLGTFQWETLYTDSYGAKYAQEVGLKYTDKDECKYTFQFASRMVPVWLARDPSLVQYSEAFEALSCLEVQAMRIAEHLAIGFDNFNATLPNHQKYPGSLAEKVRLGTCITRGLRYPALLFGQARPMLALGHFDRSFATPLWGSTHPGLRVRRSSDGIMQSIRQSSQGVAVIVGEKFAAATRGMFGYGTYHDVKTEQTTDDRFALVSFVHIADFPGDAQWLHEHLIEIQSLEHQFRAH